MSLPPTIAPYGSWDSPLTATSIVQGANATADLTVDATNGDLFHIETRPSEKGRSVLVNTETSKDLVGPEFNVRSGAHEYGGGAATADKGLVYFSNFTDGRIYRVKSDGSGSPEAITPENSAFRYSDFRVHPIHPNLLVSVLEDHTNDTPSTVVNTLVIVNSSTKSIQPLKSGADFYASPRFSPDGKKIVWQEWYHPDMPWEGALIKVADVSVDGDSVSLENEKHIAGEKLKISATYPEWVSNDTLIFNTDQTGHQNPYIYSVASGQAKPLYSQPVEEDFALPAWQFGFSRRAILPGGQHIIHSSFRDGRSTLYLSDLQHPSTHPVNLTHPFVTIDSLYPIPGGSNKDIVFLGGQGDKTKTIYRATVDVTSSKVTFTDLTPQPSKFPIEYISVPQPYSLKAPEGSGREGPIHVVLYPPQNPNYKGPEGEQPPAIVSVHGGPTALSEQNLTWAKQYFTSRGFAWLDVNYGGSSGYGRDYILKLEGEWGIVDTHDCILAPKILGSPPYSLIDPKRVFIRGGSSGGYAVLAAVSTPTVSDEDLSFFAGGTSLYGIGDLVALADETHKFESRYGDKLLGGAAGGRGEVDLIPICKERSPVNYVERIKAPLLLLQGSIDRVVPKEQSEAIYNSIKSRGGQAEYVVYEGEGHGFRQEPNMKDAMERELSFYQKLLGL